MDISRYTSWFHDGDLSAIDHQKDANVLIITMISAQIIGWDEFDHKIALSKNQTIAGKLHLEGLKQITLDEKPFHGVFKKTDASGTIMHFKVKGSEVLLEIEWVSYSPRRETIDYNCINFRAKKIWWENIPELGDAHPY